MECKEDHLLEAAKALILLSSTPPPDRPSASTTHLFKPHPLPPPAMRVASIENVLSVFLPPWGFRQKRSRYTGKSKEEQVEDPPSSAAAVTSCGHRSPDTPLDLGVGSDPSTSGSDGIPCSSEILPSKRFLAGETSAPGCDAHIKVPPHGTRRGVVRMLPLGDFDRPGGWFRSEARSSPLRSRFCHAMRHYGDRTPIFSVSAVERSPFVEGVRPSPHPIKRQIRKKTKSELQAEERILLEDQKQLMKILEFGVIERDDILAENRRLLSELASSERAPPADAEPARLKFLLPDLNEPVLELLDPDCDDN